MTDKWNMKNERNREKENETKFADETGWLAQTTACAIAFPREAMPTNSALTGNRLGQLMQNKWWPHSHATPINTEQFLRTIVNKKCVKYIYRRLARSAHRRRFPVLSFYISLNFSSQKSFAIYRHTKFVWVRNGQMYVMHINISHAYYSLGERQG